MPARLAASAQRMMRRVLPEFCGAQMSAPL